MIDFIMVTLAASLLMLRVQILDKGIFSYLMLIQSVEFSAVKMDKISFEPDLGQKTSEHDSKLLYGEGEGVNSSRL